MTDRMVPPMEEGQPCCLCGMFLDKQYAESGGRICYDCMPAYNKGFDNGRASMAAEIKDTSGYGPPIDATWKMIAEARLKLINTLRHSMAGEVEKARAEERGVVWCAWKDNMMQLCKTSGNYGGI